MGLKITKLKVEEPPSRPDLKVDLVCPHCKRELTLYVHPNDGVTQGKSKRECVWCRAVLSFEWSIE